MAGIEGNPGGPIPLCKPTCRMDTVLKKIDKKFKSVFSSVPTAGVPQFP